MLRLVLALLVAVVIVVVGTLLVGDSHPARFGVGLVAMFVGAALAPHVFVYGDWPGDKSDRAGHA